MDKCSHCWHRYMHAMALSQRAANASERRVLIREAYIWLQRYFNAEDRELARRRHLLAQR